MTNNIFDLLGIDLDATLKNLVELKNNLVNSYNDKVNDIKENVKKYDLDTQEGYEAFIDEASRLRKELSKEDSPIDKFFLKLLDKAVENVMNDHAKKNEKKNTINEIINNKVNSECKENHNDRCFEVPCDEEADDDGIEWPSSKLTYRQSRNVWKLVDEYMDTMVEPYLSRDTDDEVLDNMASGLYEFAAWILNKEED